MCSCTYSCWRNLLCGFICAPPALYVIDCILVMSHEIKLMHSGLLKNDVQKFSQEILERKGITQAQASYPIGTYKCLTSNSDESEKPARKNTYESRTVIFVDNRKGVKLMVNS